LRELTTKGVGGAQRHRRARVLLLADAGRSDQAIADALQVGRATVERTRRRFAEEGLEVALCRRAQARPSRLPKLDGAAEAHLVALACGAPPEGRARWSLRLLADRLVELVALEGGRLSYETVRRTLKKTRTSPG
jgi:transposase